ncbi:MAG TPA: glycoside hydrolase family 127 protein [Phycisphaerae bacterium]|nr:glycoside hydrolase family 127 protein [Phycisphaerae bacterium]HRY69934.1 glycoside hydrolase family 127 protein [Phycisphaerae bacterium]HSA27143.1 glycoside hydrolase family 127 protein [Phycisphaerae bacterium]
MKRSILAVALGVSGWGLFAAAAEPRFADQVQARGDTRARLERAVSRLCSAPLNDARFALSDVSLELTRRFTEYSGDISGRLLGALSAAEPVLGRDIAAIDELISGFRRHQRPDGHFGADQDLDKEINQQRDMPILWGNGRLLWALTQSYQQKPSPEILVMAKKLGDYALATHKYYAKEENFRCVGGVFASGFTTCYPSLIEGLATLGEITRDSRYTQEARSIGKLSLLDGEFDMHHSHGRMTSFRGMLEVDRVLGSPEFLAAVRRGYDRISSEYQLPTGGILELFDMNYGRDEGCSEADWLWLSLMLWRVTGESRYLDAAEHTLRNHLLAVQFRNGGFGHHTFRPAKAEHGNVPGAGIEHYGSEAYWCCSMHGAQVLADLPRYGVLHDGRRALVTWLAEVDAKFRVGDREVTITTRRHTPIEWQIEAKASSGGEIILALRVPAWARHTGLRINGEDMPGQDGWVELTVKDADKLTAKVAFPHPVRLAGPSTNEPATNGLVRVFAGADMYCLPDVSVADGLTDSASAPTVVMATGGAAQGRIPVVIEGLGGKTQRAELVPLSARPLGGCRCLFHVRTVDAPAFEQLSQRASPPPVPGRPTELVFASSGRRIVYLNGREILQYQGWEESPHIECYAQAGKNVIAVKVQTKGAPSAIIGVVRVQADSVNLATGLKTFTAIPCPPAVPDDLLTDVGTKAAEAVPLSDLGAWGAEPWKHTPAEYAATGARWIWPCQPGADGNWWLFRGEFNAE